MTHAEPDQRERSPRRGRLYNRALLALHVVYYVIMGGIIAVTLVFGIGSAVDGAQPTYWGTFTQHSCEVNGREGCQPVGRWVSDGGSIVKRHVQLDGFLGSSNSVRASYTPTGFNNDSQNNVVHVAATTGAQFWLPWLLAIVFGGVTAMQAAKWRRKRIQQP